MTPAEMREAAAVEALKAARDYAGLVEEDALRDIAAAIRALPLAEEVPTPREKLRRVREAAKWKLGFERAGKVFHAHVPAMAIGSWEKAPDPPRSSMDPPWTATALDSFRGGLADADAARTWVLDTLRAEGWDVVEEGEGDGD